MNYVKYENEERVIEKESEDDQDIEKVQAGEHGVRIETSKTIEIVPWPKVYRLHISKDE